MSSWELDRQGFVTHFMVSGPKEKDFHWESTNRNQLELECELRKIIAEHKPVSSDVTIKEGENSRLGMPWKYYYQYGNNAVDLSAFYSLVRKTEFDAAAVLRVEEAITVNAVLWSYAASDLYCNGELAGSIESPSYKPMQSRKLRFKLEAGDNLIYIACENLGVRDTRNVVMLQISDHRGKIRVTLPDRDCAEAAADREVLMNGAVLYPDRLVFPARVPEGMTYTYDHENDDLASAFIPRKWTPVSGNEILLEEGRPAVTVRLAFRTGDNETVLERKFERTEQIRPAFSEHPDDIDANREDIFRRIAAVTSLNRGEGIGFPVSNVLARKHLGIYDPQDEKRMYEMLDLIEDRYDCADFLVCGLIRYLHEYPVSTEYEQRALEVLKGFRYWMDMDGSDGMCFWSENHSLMFYASAMQVGEMYPDEYFIRAGMKGSELSEYGRERVLQWLDDVESCGFEEFLSTVYMCVTFSVLLNVVDYSEPEISKRAAAVTDRLLEMLSLHVYKDGMIAPMGRVYRSVLYPFAQEAMALMNMIDPKLPYSYGEGWLGFYATSHYQIPQGLKELMEKDVLTDYVTGNARIYLEKNSDYCITSAASPREYFERWTNETLVPGADSSRHSYTKSFNERFHGTTCFAPGVYGYQQHMWYAALDGEAAVFVNHPGSTSEDGDLRPGYWHGNGQMPAVKQQKGMLGAVYCISEEHPIHFTHLYLPECRFDQAEREGRWIFLRKGTGYMALWCSEVLTEFNGREFNCELRAYADKMAYLCICGGVQHDTDFESFKKRAAGMNPYFDQETAQLTAQDFSLKWEKGEDATQYL